jgi:DNA-binding GntR family transcriptional regulator
VKRPLPREKREARVLADWVAADLRDAILQGYFEPGEKLDQDLLAEELGVSRTPIREALKRLESEGFIEVRPHYGAFIAEVSSKDIQEIFELRGLLEAEVVRQATSSIPDSVLDELEQMLTEAQKAHAEGDYVAQFEADISFHQTLRDFAKNDLLREVLDGVNNRVNTVRRFAQTRPGPHVNAFALEHLAILDAIRERDVQRAATLMRRHLENSGERVLELVDPRSSRQ